VSVVTPAAWADRAASPSTFYFGIDELRPRLGVQVTFPRALIAVPYLTAVERLH
jgi:hypothetical protein